MLVTDYNYHIFKIPLANLEVISFLERETNISLKNKNDKKELLHLFINYLTSNYYSYSQVFLEQRNLSKYQEAWNAMNDFGISDINYDHILSNYDKILDLKKFSYMTNLNYYYSRNKKSLLHISCHLLTELLNDVTKQEQLLNLTLIAIEDLHIPIDLIWNNNEIDLIKKTALKYPSCNTKIKELLIDDSIFKLDNDELNKKFRNGNFINDKLFLQKLIFLSFNFNFKDLKSEIENWNPESTSFILKKAGLLSLFDLDKAKQLLIDNKYKFKNSKIEEQLYYYQILRYYSSQYLGYKQKDLNEKIIQIKSLGFDDLHKKFQQLLDEINEKPVKLYRYGTSRFSVDSSFSLSNDFSPPVKGVQFMRLLLDFCLPLHTGLSYFIDKEVWYKVYKKTFQIYPFPAVFFCLQYSDEEILRRMAQDFIYSDDLIEETNILLPRLLRRYLDSDTPLRYKKSILYFCSEFFVAVKPILWQEVFCEIWEHKDFQKFAFDSTRSGEYVFTVAAIPFIRDVKIIRAIIDSCLDNSNLSIAIDFLYYFSENR